jgi:transcriptional regulator with GAF, ATPase, and Fis domain
VRELKNVVQRILFRAGDVVTAEEAIKAIGYGESFATDNDDLKSLFDPQNIIPLKDAEKFFREKYFKFVRSNSLSDKDAATKLGLAPSNFYRMAKELGMK